ncbi:MAG: carbon monoxide dehydrogenase subunit G [Glaciecola sp.]|jgi:carbon monoxide dehydrogenase subunit G
MKFDTSFTIKGKSAEDVFDFVAEPENGTKWAGSAKEITAEGEPGVGRKIKAKVDLIKTFEITQTVDVFDRPTAYSFSASSPIKIRYDFAFAADGDGTKVNCAIDADPGKFIPGGGILLKGTFKKLFNSDMKRLEAALNEG